MNCKPGDLAVIVSGFDQNIGAIVRVIEKDVTPIIDDQFWWVVEAMSRVGYSYPGGVVVGFLDPGECTHVADVCLRPIRDNDGEDEILRIAGKPHSVEV